jgi:hypothetical protein
MASKLVTLFLLSLPPSQIPQFKHPTTILGQIRLLLFRQRNRHFGDKLQAFHPPDMRFRLYKLVDLPPLHQLLHRTTILYLHRHCQAEESVHYNAFVHMGWQRILFDLLFNDKPVLLQKFFHSIFYTNS